MTNTATRLLSEEQAVPVGSPTRLTWTWEAFPGPGTPSWHTRPRLGHLVTGNILFEEDITLFLADAVHILCQPIMDLVLYIYTAGCKLL